MVESRKGGRSRKVRLVVFRLVSTALAHCDFVFAYIPLFVGQAGLYDT